MEKLAGLSCTEYIEKLASRDSVPGGGSASALAGAIGAALGNMVGELTVGKAKYAEVEDDLKRFMEEAKVLREDFLSCVDEDAAAFEPLSRAYAIPKDDPSREERMEKALHMAAEVPLKVMVLSCQGIELMKEFGEKGSILAISDAATGVMLCRAALFGGAINVIANTGLMKDKEHADALDMKVAIMMDKYAEMADKVYADVWEKLP